MKNAEDEQGEGRRFAWRNALDVWRGVRKEAASPGDALSVSAYQASLPTASRRWENPSLSIIRLSPRTIR